MSIKEITSSMYRLADNVGDPGDAEFDEDIWADMYYLDYYYNLAKNGLISSEDFDFAFFSYLENGIPVDPDRIRRHNRIESET